MGRKRRRWDGKGNEGKGREVREAKGRMRNKGKGRDGRGWKGKRKEGNGKK